MPLPDEVLGGKLHGDAALLVPLSILNARPQEPSGISIVRPVVSVFYGTDSLNCAASPKPITKLLTATEARELAPSKETPR